MRQMVRAWRYRSLPPIPIARATASSVRPVRSSEFRRSVALRPTRTQVGVLPLPGLAPVPFFEGIGLAHHLTERLASLTVVFEDREPARGPGRELADFARDFRQPQRQGAGEPAVPRDHLPAGPHAGDHQRDQDPFGADALEEPVGLTRWIAIDGKAVLAVVEIATGEGAYRGRACQGGGHGRGILFRSGTFRACAGEGVGERPSPPIGG